MNACVREYVSSVLNCNAPYIALVKKKTPFCHVYFETHLPLSILAQYIHRCVTGYGGNLVV